MDKSKRKAQSPERDPAANGASNAADLKQQLRIALDAEAPDPIVILQLAGRIADCDTSRVRFSIDAGHVNRLGLELVTRKETALAELIKNSYDADAEHVTLTFHTAADDRAASGGQPDTEEIGAKRGPGSRLVVADDGSGMTRNDLVSGFMRLSTASKVDNPRSAIFKRERAGSKGIGRFAAQRLGRKLTIETRSDNEPTGYRLTIDWDAYTAHEDLTLIQNRIEPLERKRRGTELIIGDLRDEWSPRALDELVRYVSPLVQPFALTKTGALTDRAPDFTIVIHQPGKPTRDVQEEIYEKVAEHALARIDGHVAGGRGFVRVTSTRLALDKQLVIQRQDGRRYEGLDGVRFFTYYFNLAPAYMPPMGARRILRDTLRRYGGIRLYRNGFRVGSYGERDNDWLSLEAEYRKRSRVLDPLGTVNFLGFVEVHDPSGEVFQESSSREGLLENDATRQLQEFMLEGLIDAVREVSSVKSRIPGTRPVTGQEIRARVRRIRDNLKSLRTARGAERDEIINALERDAGALQRQLTKYDRAQLQELGMLRVLASLGITVTTFMHEVSQTLSFIEGGVRNVVEGRRLPNQMLRSLDASLGLLRGYTRYFQEVLRENSQRELKPLEIHDIVNSFKILAEPLCADRDVRLNAVAEGYNVYTKPMHASEWSAILLNLLTNSIKAIRRTNRRGRVDVNIWRDGKSIVLEFCDDGDGIQPENRARIFDPFFTTSSTRDRTEMSGMGLGLKIVKDVLDANRGEIELFDPHEGFSTCFRVVVPAASEEELEWLQ